MYKFRQYKYIFYNKNDLKPCANAIYLTLHELNFTYKFHRAETPLSMDKNGGDRAL
jgi:hypothetical protein